MITKKFFNSERRKHLNDPERYINAHFKLEQEYLDLLETHKQEVLEKLKISSEQWENSIQFHSVNQEFFEYYHSFVINVK